MTKEEILSKHKPMGEYPCFYHESQIESMMDEYAKHNGIHWHEITKGELPPLDPESNFHVSVEVLLTDGEEIASGTYSFTQKDFCFNGIWEPTHWAFINKPQTT